MDTDKLKLIEKAKQLHQELSELVLYAGVGEKGWKGLIENIQEKRESRIQFIIDFFEELKREQWRRMYEIWTLPNMTPEMWHNYKILFDGPPKLIEQKYMRIASKEMIARVVRFKEELRVRIRKERDGLIGEPQTVATEEGT